MAASRPEQAVFNGFAFGTAQGRVLEGAHKIEKNIISEFSEACIGQGYLPPGAKPAAGNKYIIDGQGWLGLESDEHVRQAVAAIKETVRNTRKDQLPLRANLMGYSRGAVTCLRIANALYEDESFRNRVEFNILAIDPVAGSGNKADWAARNIPPNVKNYVAPIHSDEPDRILRAQTLGRARAQDPSKTNVTFLPLPGSHSSAILVRDEPTIDDNAAIVLRHIAYDFMSSHGAKFRGDKDGVPHVVISKENNNGKLNYTYQAIETVEERPLVKKKKGKKSLGQEKKESGPLDEKKQERSSVRQRVLDAGLKLTDAEIRNRRTLESYAWMKKNDDSYRYKMKPGSPRRSGVTHDRLKDYEPHAEFFNNRHQSALFAKEYPKVYRYLFEQNIPDVLTPKITDDFKVDGLALLRSGKEKSSRATSAMMSNTEDKVIDELMIMNEINPQLFQSLAGLGVKLTNGVIGELPPPGGIARIDRWDISGKQSKSDLDILKESLIQEMRVYQAERSWWRDLFHIKNTYHYAADHMCNLVHTIMSKNYDDKTKVAHFADVFGKMRNILGEHVLTGRFYSAVQKCADLTKKTAQTLERKQPTRKPLISISEDAKRGVASKLSLPAPASQVASNEAPQGSSARRGQGRRT